MQKLNLRLKFYSLKKLIFLASNYQSLPHMLNTVYTQTTYSSINSDRELNIYIHTLWICNNNALPVFHLLAELEILRRDKVDFTQKTVAFKNNRFMT